MISEKDFEKEFIKIIDENISKKSKSSIKNDFSLVTDIDINVENLIFILKIFQTFRLFQENQSHAKSYNLKINLQLLIQ